jgi:hypothetical protein
MHNDGQPVNPEKFAQTRNELIAQFGALSIYPLTVHGVWEHEGKRYEDELRRIVIDVDDTAENHQFFVEFKAKLLERFQQLEIYMVYYAIDLV